MNKKKITEEGITIIQYGEKITSKLEVFYNPIMKLNRDLTLLFIQSYFTKPIIFCDPMAASGIRELRLLKKIPHKFKKIIIGDISEKAIKDLKKNFELNNTKIDEKTIIMNQNAINTLSIMYYDFIEIDPFGSPVPYLDIAFQRIRHNGIISVTATDTAALCGCYPKTAYRRYGIKIYKTLCYNELGIRNLISYVIRECAKYDKKAEPLFSYSSDHYYKIFFKITDGRTKATNALADLKYLQYDKKTQDIIIQELENNQELIGRTYTNKLYNKKIIQKMLENMNLLKDKKKAEKILTQIYEEYETLGYYNIHKLQKQINFQETIKFEELIKQLKEEGFEATRTHFNPLGIKTNAKYENLKKILLKN